MSAWEMLSVSAANHGISVWRLCGKERGAFMVELRRRIARELRDAGFSYPDIGHAMNRDHSSIMSLLGASPGTRRAKRWLP